MSHSQNDHHQGDCTVFRGCFQIDKPLDQETINIIDALSCFQCFARDVTKLSDALGIDVESCKRLYGQEGQYYLGPDQTSLLHQRNKRDMENNDFDGQPPRSCLRWIYHRKTHTIRADGGEKFYYYPEWITLLVQDVLAPRGYIVNGTVEYENRGSRPEEYDSDAEYIEPEEEEDFDEDTRDDDRDVWGVIKIRNNKVRCDHPVWRG